MGSLPTISSPMLSTMRTGPRAPVLPSLDPYIREETAECKQRKLVAVLDAALALLEEDEEDEHHGTRCDRSKDDMSQ
jgi:hypothetical protein